MTYQLVPPDEASIMEDICGLEDDQEILDVLRWTAKAILKAARAEAQET